MASTTIDGQASLQDRYFPDLPCFGCGPANTEGLQLKSYVSADARAKGDSAVSASGAEDSEIEVIAEFVGLPRHDNGLGYLNGGIIATVLDCHSAAAVTHEAYTRGWPPLPGAALPYVTAGLDVTYLRPAPLGEPVTLRARITAASEAEIVAKVWMEWEEKVRSRADAVWKRWRPR